MKLAEALLLRADAQKRLESVRERIGKNTVVQEGEQPSEDPNKLLAQAHAIATELQGLVFAINSANFDGRTAHGRPLTAALAERDSLTLRHSIIRSAASSAAKPPDRYGLKEIRWVKMVDVAALQESADELAVRIREVNAEIQAANWQIDTLLS